jgi:Hypervirulence associated proteins TUDOR domain
VIQDEPQVQAAEIEEGRPRQGAYGCGISTRLAGSAHVGTSYRRDAGTTTWVSSYRDVRLVFLERAMTKRFKVGDHVSWNSEAGRVSGRIIKVHTRDVSYKGYTHHASKDDPQYAIKSDKSDHVAMHKGSALRRLRG